MPLTQHQLTAFPIRGATALIVAFAATSFAVALNIPSGDIVKLTDRNFDGLTETLQHPWLVAVTHPLCSVCHELKPIWKQLAQQNSNKVHVAEVDGMTAPVLQQRFAITKYPSIYFLHGDETRPYRGPLTLQHIQEFADGAWQSIKPVPSLRSPVSSYGRMQGRIRMLPYSVRDYYRYLHHDRKYGILTLLAAFLTVPVVFGLLTICALDVLFSSTLRQQHQNVAAPNWHPHQH